MRRGIDPRDVLNSLHGNNRSISEFFAEEVFSSLPEDIRQFLTQTSILDRFNAALCESLTGRHDASYLLRTVDARGLFLQHLDEEHQWFRYHHLFEAFLKRRVQELVPAALRELHQRASRWFWEADLPAEAIAHALSAGEPELAAVQLERRCLELTYVGKLRLVAKFAAEIPVAILARYPALLLTIAWLKTRALEVKEAAQLIADAATRLDQIQAGCEQPPTELRKLRYLLLHQQMVLAAACDNMNEIEVHCERLITDFPDEQQPYLCATIYGHLMAVRRQQFRIAEGERLVAFAAGALRRSIYVPAAVGLQGCHGPLLMVAGKPDQAERVLLQGREEGIRYSGPRSSTTAFCSLPLAEIAYDAGNLGRAQQLIDESWSSALSFGYAEQLMSAFLTQAKLFLARGNGAEALRILDQGMAIAVDRKLDRLALAITAERVRQMVGAGAVEDALQCVAAVGLPVSSPPTPPGSLTARDELRAIIWVRIVLACGRYAEGLSTARYWRNFCLAHSVVRSLFQWNLLLARLYALSGNARAAQRALQDALVNDTARLWARSFLDEGPSMRTLLEAKLTAEQCSGCPSDPLLQNLLQGFGGYSAASLMPAAEPEDIALGTLNMREREILGLVGAGLRNREVAARLGTTEGTIKWYLQQVYDKIGTRRRHQAVERARKFGLIVH